MHLRVVVAAVRASLGGYLRGWVRTQRGLEAWRLPPNWLLRRADRGRGGEVGRAVWKALVLRPHCDEHRTAEGEQPGNNGVVAGELEADSRPVAAGDRRPQPAAGELGE